MEKILLYTTDNIKYEKISSLCRSLNIGLQKLTQKDIGCTLASISSGSPKQAKDASVPPLYSQSELMIFSGLSNDKLDIFLERYKKEGMQPVRLKAIVTPFNCMWSIYDLTKELIKENKAIG